jgi:hypothetical protein
MQSCTLGSAFHSFVCILNKMLGQYCLTKCNVLRIIPIKIDGAKKIPSEVMVNTMLIFPFSREATWSNGCGRRMAIEPFSNQKF